MKKNIFFQIGMLFFLLIFTSSCVGWGRQYSISHFDYKGPDQSYSRKTEQDGWTFFPRVETALGDSKAAINYSVANRNNAIAERIRQGKALDMLKTGAFHNVGSSSIYVENPDTHEKIVVAPSQYVIIYTKKIPRHIKAIIGGKEYEERVYSTDKEIRGIQLDYGADLKG